MNNGSLLAGGNTLVEGFNAGCPLLCSLQGHGMIKSISLHKGSYEYQRKRVKLPDNTHIILQEPRVEIPGTDVALGVYRLGCLVDDRLTDELERGCSGSANNQVEAGMSLLSEGFGGPYIQLEGYYLQATPDVFRAILHRPITIEEDTIVCGVTFQFLANHKGRTGIRKIVI